MQSIQEKLSGFSIGGLNLGDVFGAMTPAIQTVMPLVQSFVGVFSQIVDLGTNHIKPVLTEIFGFVVNEGIPAVMPLLSTVVSLVGTTLVNAIKVAVDVVGKVLPVVEPVILGVIGFLKQIATVGVKAVNFIIGALNKIQLKIPETLFGIPVPVIGGKSFGFNLSPVSVPAFANGGMTNGPSIAGEAGTEAVISFRRGVREKNVDKGFISDSYACRKGKGAHAALDQLQYWMRQADRGGPAYTLKLDVSKYFYRIDHEILLKILNRKIADPRMMWLFRVILHSDQTKFGLPEGMSADEVPPECRLEDTGVPIGNLTSQMFANIYLDVLDQYVKHTLHIHWYIRYMDDIIIIGHDKQELAHIRDEIAAFLRRELNLALNHKTSIQPLKQGVEFVGVRVWPTHRRLRHTTIRGIKLRLSQVLAQYEANEITAESVERTIGSYRGVLSHCECMALKHKLNQTYGKFYIIKKERGEQNNGNQSIFLCEGRKQSVEQELQREGVPV